MNETIFLEKHFNKGDLYVTTSGRKGLCMGIASEMWAARFDHDIDFEEAANIHLANMKKDYPGMFKDYTIDKVKKVLDKNDKYFLNNLGEVQTYKNHEPADEFDKLYFSNKFELSELSRLKDKYVREFNVPISKYSEDEFGEFRIFDDITEWIKENIK
jgi:hypothetical protein